MNVDVAGGSLAYRLWDGRADRTPLFALHGFTGSSQSWEAFADGIDGDRRVYAFDLPGHGLTRLGTSDSPCDMHAFTRALDEAVAALDVDTFDLLGYSLGGRTALFAALHMTHRPRRLILESASPGLADPRARAARRESDEELACFAESRGIEAFVTRWEETPVLASQRDLPAGVAQRLRAGRLACTAAGLAMSLRGMGTGAQPYLGDSLGRLSIPVLCVAGDRDEKFSALARWMAQRMGDAACRIFPDAGHSVHLEVPQPYARTITEFLTEQ